MTDDLAGGASLERPDPKDVSEHPRRKGLIASVLAVSVGNAFAPAAAACTTPVFTHVLGVEGQGVTAAATAPLLLVTVGATLGIPDTLTFAAARAPLLARGLLFRASAVTAVAGLIAMLAVVFALSPLSGHHHNIAHLMLLASVFIVPTLILGVFRGVALGLQRFRLLAGQQVIAALVLLLGTLLLFLLHDLTVTTATVLTAASPMAGYLAYIPLRDALAKRSSRFDPRMVREWRLARYAGRTWIGSVTGVLLMRLDQTLMVSLSGARQLGLYTVAVSVSEVTLLFNAAIANVVFVAEAAQSDTQRLTQAGRISTLGVAVGSIGIAVVAHFTLGVIFGHGFRQAFPSMLILLAAVVGGNPGSMAGAGLGARGHPGLRSLALTAAFVINLALLFILVPPFGAIGASVATLIANLVASNMCIFFLWRQENVSPRDFYLYRQEDWVLLRRLMTNLR